MVTKKWKTLQELFSNASRWIQDGWFGKDRRSPTEYKSADLNNATCFCLLGGVEKVYGKGKRAIQVRTKLAQALKENGYTGSLPEFNDHYETTIHAVRKLVKQAGV